MSAFQVEKGRLYAEEVPLAAVAEAVGTPAYVYSAAAITGQFHALTEAFAGVPHLVAYSVKANSTLALLRLFASMGAGFDVVSGGELARVRRAGGAPSRSVFSGVGKTREEMAEALAAGLLMFNVESAEELEALDAVGRAAGRRAPFALRVNPDVDARTHRYIATGLKTSKFGVPFDEALALYRRSKRMRGVEAVGVDCHIGSQLTDLAPMRQAVEKVAGLYRGLREAGFALRYLDVGGGLGISYDRERPPTARQYAEVVRGATRDLGAELILEPGRFLVGNAGVLLTRVLYRKQSEGRTWVVVDAGMNDLMRPALYEAFHRLVPLKERRGRAQPMDVVGPVCESTDVLARARPLVLPRVGDLYALMDAGAYGMSMASTYNSRPRPPEVLVSGGSYRVIRERERVQDLWRGEAL